MNRTSMVLSALIVMGAGAPPTSAQEFDPERLESVERLIEIDREERETETDPIDLEREAERARELAEERDSERLDGDPEDPEDLRDPVPEDIDPRQ